MSYMCIESHHMLKGDLVCFAVDSDSKRQNSSKRMELTWCAICGARYDSNTMEVVGE